VDIEPWGNTVTLACGEGIEVVVRQGSGSRLELSAGDGHMSVWADEVAIYDQAGNELDHWYQGEYPGPLKPTP
jgi:hypothetical protein